MEQEKANSAKLILASEKGHTEVVQTLLDKGINVNATNKFWETALMLASQEGHKDVVQLRLYNGAEVNGKKNDGTTPLIYALMHALLRRELGDALYILYFLKVQKTVNRCAYKRASRKLGVIQPSPTKNHAPLQLALLPASIS